MDILVLGGTRFLGRTIVEAALAAGHTVTMHNRGQTNADLFPQVEKIQGDRTTPDGLAGLRGRRWDVVIDTCGYVPRVVGLSTELLRDSGQYIFISSISVYGPPLAAWIDEGGPVQPLPQDTPADAEEITGATYGPLKVLCEQAVEQAFPGRALHVRSGLIVGPHDPTDRFTYWPVRFGRGGAVLCPPEDAPVQIIDVRDQAAWIIRMAEVGTVGVYNVTGPAVPYRFGDLITACAAVAGEQAVSVIRADAPFLLAHEVAPWAGLPLWLDGEDQHMSQVTVGKAIVAGLTFRPLADTVRDTLAWYTAERGLATDLRTGLSPAREAEVIAAWHAR